LRLCEKLISRKGAKNAKRTKIEEKHLLCPLSFRMRFALGLCLALLLSGCQRQPPMTVSGQSIGYWLAALKDKNPRVRQKAVEALGNVGKADPAAIPALIGALQDPNPTIRGKAALALLKSGPDAQEAIPALTQLLEDKDPKVRLYAAKALERIQE
jgi:HEAT repeat protein